MSVKIPFHDIGRIQARHKKPLLTIIENILESGRALQGQHTKELVENLKSITGRRFVLPVGSCTDALSLALRTLKLAPVEEVLVTSYSFIASMSCIREAGAIPSFVDICPETAHMDIGHLEQKINERTRAIIAVSLFGQVMDIDSVEEVAEANDLLIIEDAAQSFGAKYKGIPAGNLGYISCLSFDPTKSIWANGTAGALLTDDEFTYDEAKFYHYKNWGRNSQISEIDAAIVNYWLKRREELKTMREAVAEQYISGLDGMADVKILEEEPHSTQVYHKFVIRAKDRDNLKVYLAGKGIETKIHYEIPFEMLPNARLLGRQALSLPIYPCLSDDDVDYIIGCIRLFYS